MNEGCRDDGFRNAVWLMVVGVVGVTVGLIAGYAIGCGG